MAPRKRKRGASEPEVVTRLRRGGVSILDAVFTELPDVFYGEILPKLDLLDTLNLAQVSKSWNDAVWSVGGVRSLEPKIKAHMEMLEADFTSALNRCIGRQVRTTCPWPGLSWSQAWT